MNQYIIPNLAKGVGVLRLLSEHPSGLSALQIERHTKLPRTTVFRILKTLQAEGLVCKRANQFMAGPGLLEIGLNALNQLDIRALAVPILQDLTHETGFTSHLAVPSGRQSLLLEVCDCSGPVRVASRAGSAVDLHCSSTGKVFLAFLYADAIKEFYQDRPLTRRTASTITDLEQLQLSLEQIRKQGYAVDDGEYHEDIRCVAAPVYHGDGSVIAAVGITAPANQLQKAKYSQLAQKAIIAAEKLSQQLGAPQRLE